MTDTDPTPAPDGPSGGEWLRDFIEAECDRVEADGDAAVPVQNLRAALAILPPPAGTEALREAIYDALSDLSPGADGPDEWRDRWLSDATEAVMAILAAPAQPGSAPADGEGPTADDLAAWHPHSAVGAMRMIRAEARAKDAERRLAAVEAVIVKWGRLLGPSVLVTDLRAALAAHPGTDTSDRSAT